MITGLDGSRCGNGSGDSMLYEIFDPPWWRLDRWASWVFTARGARGTLTIFRNGQSKVVRCRAVQSWPPRPDTTVYPSNPLH
jgi:hypothetical protein